jgi:hypothetical protein
LAANAKLPESRRQKSISKTFPIMSSALGKAEYMQIDNLMCFQQRNFAIIYRGKAEGRRLSWQKGIQRSCKAARDRREQGFKTPTERRFSGSRSDGDSTPSERNLLPSSTDKGKTSQKSKANKDSLF